jgi:hypothetical protein
MIIKQQKSHLCKQMASKGSKSKRKERYPGRTYSR